MNEEQVREILAQVYEKHGWTFEAKKFREGVLHTHGMDLALQAGIRIRDWAVKECAERVAGIESSIAAVAE